MSEKVYLVDGSGYIFRAFYAIAPLSNREGFPTNALFGFVRMLLRLLKDAAGGHVVVVFDAGKETFRNQMYDKYKANRSECPPDLLKQMPYFRELTRAMGLPVLELPGYEADDVIGALTDRCVAAGFETTVVSGDKDLMQLISERVVVWDTMKDKFYRAPEVIEKFGVPPHQVVEVLALIGDDSDNVPGLSGCGPKTAAQLIQKFGTAEAVLAAREQIANDSGIRNRKKIAETLAAEEEMVRLSRRLVEIDRKAPIKVPLRHLETGELTGDHSALDEITDKELLHALTWHGAEREALQELTTRFEFASLLSDLSIAAAKPQPHDPKYKYRTILAADFPAWLEEFRKQDEFAFDTETTSLDPYKAELIGASFCWSEGEAYYLPFGHRGAEGQVKLADFVAGVKDRFCDHSVGKFGQNLKYDIEIMAVQGIEVCAPRFDTMVASYVLSPDRGVHNLTVLAQEYLRRAVIEYDDVTKDLTDFSEVLIPVATEYACQDAHLVWLIVKQLQARLEQQGLLKVFRELEMPLVPVLSRMEQAGICLDTKLLNALSEEFGEKLGKMEKEIFELAGGTFNINSPKQLGEVLFGKLALPTKGLKKTKTGVSTDSTVLEKLAEIHPLPGRILEYRSIHKLKSTYVDTLPAQLSAITGRLHTRLNQTVTGTGRLSSSDPNLQNIPVQTAEGRRIRETFIADPDRGLRLISADYSQIELRVLAHLSGDKNLVRAFKEGLDIHSITAREIMGLPEDAEISSEQRRAGKTINFGVVYGMSGFRLGRDLGIPVSVANEYIANYFARYSGVKEFFSRVEAEAEKQGYVTTLFGRKRILAQIDSSGRDQGFVRRAAMNAPIQGTAADIMKLAMIRLDDRIRKEKLPVKMLLQIHDELLFEAQPEAVEGLIEIIRAEMQNVIQLSVPLIVDVGSGKNWQQAHN